MNHDLIQSRGFWRRKSAFKHYNRFCNYISLVTQMWVLDNVRDEWELYLESRAEGHDLYTL